MPQLRPCAAKERENFWSSEGIIKKVKRQVVKIICTHRTSKGFTTKTKNTSVGGKMINYRKTKLLFHNRRHLNGREGRKEGREGNSTSLVKMK